jgi:hypothetical protein
VNDDQFARQHLRYVAAWAISDLDDARRRGRLKRALVCWWAHRARRLGPGTYRSVSCWACVAGRRP